jgi:hypothetical protein
MILGQAGGDALFDYANDIQGMRTLREAALAQLQGGGFHRGGVYQNGVL